MINIIILHYLSGVNILCEIYGKTSTENRFIKVYLYEPVSFFKKKSCPTQKVKAARFYLYSFVSALILYAPHIKSKNYRSFAPG